MRQRHHVDLIVRDENHRRVDALMELRDLRRVRTAKRGVEVGQRLVEQKQMRGFDDGATDRDALTLTCRKSARVYAPVNA